MGTDAWARPSGSRARGQGSGTALAAPRDPDPLGDLLSGGAGPASTSPAARAAARVRRSGARHRPPGAGRDRSARLGGCFRFAAVGDSTSQPTGKVVVNVSRA